ncbi:MAG: hypothetical protein WC028_02925 [Candidatus Obscuribacterales bacterium]
MLSARKQHLTRPDLSKYLIHSIHKPSDQGVVKIKELWDWDLSCLPHLDLLQEVNCNRARLILRAKSDLPKHANDDVQGEEEDHDDTLDIFPYQIFSEWREFHEEYPLTMTSSSLDVLKQIISTGHLRAGWSFRGGRPTVYGPRGACCFTEMPLNALLKYVQTGHRMVGNYGIALPKAEVFQRGGRPVIYGTSGNHSEDLTGPETYGIPKESWIEEKLVAPSWPRILSESCGIGIHEQYRYVATNMGAFGRVDWTHEREWRWPFSLGDECPGLSLWLEDGEPPFSEILIFVETEAEALEILDHMKALYDADHYNEGDWYYSQEKLAITKVFSLEKFDTKAARLSLESIRLEDIPMHSLRTFQAPVATRETIDKLKTCIADARIAATEAVQKYEFEYPYGNHSENEQWFGHAQIMLRSSQSELVSAFQTLEQEQEGEEEFRVGRDGDIHITALGQSGYLINGLKPWGISGSGAIGSDKAASRAIIETFSRHFPDVKFEINDYLN